MRRWTVVIALWAGALLMGAPVASGADPWRPVPTSCVAQTDLGGTCTADADGDGLWQVAFSPDGRHAYGLAYDADAVLLLDRDETGALVPREGDAACLSEAPRAGCTEVRMIDDPMDVEVSADGLHVYVAGWFGKLAVFDRAEDGTLTQKELAAGCLDDGGTDGCANGRGLTSGTDIVLGPDGEQLYLFGDEVGVFTFDIGPDGALTQKPGEAGCLIEVAIDDCGVLPVDLGPARQAALIPDGAQLYVPGGSSLLILDRGADGVLTQRDEPAGCLAAADDDCVTDARLASVHALVASPDGGQLYATTDTGVLTFAVGEDGGLSPQSCVNLDGSGGCADGRNLGPASNAALSPDGESLVVSGIDSGGNGITVLARGADGDLAPVAGADGCLSLTGLALDEPEPAPDGCHASASVGAEGDVEFLSDEQLVIGSYYATGSLTVLKRDFYPECADVAAAVGHASPAAVQLSCADRNGDALGYVVTAPPAHGTLGAVDQAGAAVTYTPSAGFAGADTFSYSGAAAGLSSAPARATLSVAAAPASPPPPPGPPALIPPPPGPPRVDADVALRWRVRGQRIKLERMRITQLPAGAEAELRCKGRRCPLRRTRIFTPSRRGAIDVVRPLEIDQRRFRAGQRLDLRISAPGHVGQVLRFNLKRGKQPKALQRCTPVGSSVIRRTC